MRRLATYIHERKDWPNFTWNHADIAVLLGKVHHMQGLILGRMQALGFQLQEEAVLETLTQDVIKSNEIEGEFLDLQQVRSSLARRLGMNVPGLVRSDRNVDGIVEMMLDATQHFEKPLTKERLFDWQASLFPRGRSGMQKVIVGNFRDDSTGPMQVVSGALGKERVHFQAPDAKRLKKEMSTFLKWFNAKDQVDPVLKAAISHFYFVTLHPFEDGNGRIVRALTDMQLARADGSKRRFYSMSAQILTWRKFYYEELEAAQKGTMEISEWLKWFLNCLLSALYATDVLLENVLYKAKYWEKHHSCSLNVRQKKMLNKLLDGLDGKLSSSKWAKMTKCSADTALRDIQDLMYKKILVKENAGGRSTNYELKK